MHEMHTCMRCTPLPRLYQLINVSTFSGKFWEEINPFSCFRKSRRFNFIRFCLLTDRKSKHIIGLGRGSTGHKQMNSNWQDGTFGKRFLLSVNVKMK